MGLFGPLGLGPLRDTLACSLDALFPVFGIWPVFAAVGLLFGRGSFMTLAFGLFVFCFCRSGWILAGSDNQVDVLEVASAENVSLVGCCWPCSFTLLGIWPVFAAVAGFFSRIGPWWDRVRILLGESWAL